MFSHCGVATMLCTSDFDDQMQYTETDTHQSGQVDIPKYDEEIISHSLDNACVPHHMINDNAQLTGGQLSYVILSVVSVVYV